MILNCNIPPPVNLNCWKHHAGFIKEQIHLIAHKKISEPGLKKILLTIGESQMDIYLGKLTSTQIAKGITETLKKNFKFKLNNYSKWLSEEKKDYKLLTISDKSVWTLRLGKDQERYIHIHPGRCSPLTIRVKSSTLKTYILSEVFSIDKETKQDELMYINKLRVGFLNLPPLKSISSSKGLLRLRNLFNDIKV
ncbi:MAG: hypothetical protein P8Y81_06935 [Ignavibacteriaceae bacterium]|jgi:hypothetical protein